jgi:hypothetical protein
MTIITDTTSSSETSVAPAESTAPGTLELLFKEAKQRERRRRLRWSAVILAAVLTAGVVAGVTYGAGGSTARASHGTAALAVGTDAKVLTCLGADVARPVTYVITCADGNTALTKTHWSSWTSKGARGIATFAMNLCKPYCAASKMTYYPHSVVTFSSPEATKHGTLFSLLTVRYPSAGHTKLFRFSFRGDPSFAK